jgi:hypothetical protein
MTEIFKGIKAKDGLLTTARNAELLQAHGDPDLVTAIMAPVVNMFVELAEEGGMSPLEILENIHTGAEEAKSEIRSRT